MSRTQAKGWRVGLVRFTDPSVHRKKFQDMVLVEDAFQLRLLMIRGHKK